MTADQLPTGRRGQALAVAIALTGLALLWFGMIDPALSWFRDRDTRLEQRQALLHHIQAVAATLPAMKAASSNHAAQDGAGRNDSADAVLLPGATDAVAAADLQERVQKMASAAGVNLTAVETLPATPTGPWHKVPLRISLMAPWPILMDLLLSIEQSPTRILIDDVHFHSPATVSRPTVLPIQASMVLYGFRSADGRPGT
jgi:hypothetical protein